MFQTHQRWVDARAACGYDYTPCSPQITWLKTGRVGGKKEEEIFLRMHLQSALTGMKCGCLTLSFPSCFSDSHLSMFRKCRGLNRLRGCWLRRVFKSKRQRQDETETKWCAEETNWGNRGEQTDVGLQILHIILFSLKLFSHCGVWSRLSANETATWIFFGQLDFGCPRKTCSETYFFPSLVINMLFGYGRDWHSRWFESI